MQNFLTLALLGFAGSSMAFPKMALEHARELGIKFAEPEKRAVGFNAALQHVDVSGIHAFVPPVAGDQRGPCPGLNALANHGYLPHNGVATIGQFITQTNQVYGMGVDLATFLAVYGAIFDGNLLGWSVGGSTSSLSLNGLLSQPQGLIGSHNKYESDGSPTRGDLYEYGNNYKVVLSQWNDLYSQQDGVPDSQANYDLSVLTPFRAKRVAQSKANNPNFFSGPFSGVLVQPAAYTFAYRFMANKSAEHPEGVLNRDVLKSFFAMSGSEGSFQYSEGHEQIPQNFYKRAIGDEYTIPYFLGDVVAAAAEYPEFIEIGGNTGKTNSFAGVDLGNLTGGVFNAGNILQGNNLGCFVFQLIVQSAPDILEGVVGDVTSAVATLSSAVNNALAGLTCPKLGEVDTSLFSKFPGYKNLKSNGQY